MLHRLVALALALSLQSACGTSEYDKPGGSSATSTPGPSTSMGSGTQGSTDGVSSGGASTGSTSISATSVSAGGTGNTSDGTPDGTGGTQATTNADSGGSSTGGSGGSASSDGNAGDGGAGGLDAAACEDCDACLSGGMFVECNSPEEGGCVCEFADPPGRDDYEDLAACALESPCPPARFALGGPIGSWTDRDCLMNALRDKMPGRYVFQDYEADLSYINTDWLLLVTDSGEVLISGVTDSGTVSSSTATRTYQPTERCTLEASDFFGTCLAEPTSNVLPGSSACTSLTGWVTQCAAATVTCP